MRVQSIVQILKAFPIIALTFASISCNFQKRVNDERTYEFLNYIITQKKAINFDGIDKIADQELFPVEYSKQDSIELIKLDSIFKPEDIAFIREQMMTNSGFRLRPGSIKGKKIISSDQLRSFGEVSDQNFWTRLEEKYGTDKFATFSKPIFSKDGSTAIWRSNYYTKSGGAGETMIFRHTGSSWEPIKMLYYWDN
jgi:hypothetical protein